MRCATRISRGHAGPRGHQPPVRPARPGRHLRCTIRSAVAVALDPSLVTIVETEVVVETRGEHTLGQTVGRPAPPPPRWPPRQPASAWTLTSPAPERSSSTPWVSAELQPPNAARPRARMTSSGASRGPSPWSSGSITDTPHSRSVAIDAHVRGCRSSGSFTDGATRTGVPRPIASAATDSARLSATPAASLLSELKLHGATSTSPNGGRGRIASSKYDSTRRLPGITDRSRGAMTRSEFGVTASPPVAPTPAAPTPTPAPEKP